MDSVKRNCAEAAYFFKTHGYYGSTAGTITALKRRKDTKDCDRAALKEALDHALAILERQEELGREVLKQNRTSFHSQLTPAQFELGTTAIRDSLTKEFPNDSETIDYFIAMNWHQPHHR